MIREHLASPLGRNRGYNGRRTPCNATPPCSPNPSNAVPEDCSMFLTCTSCGDRTPTLFVTAGLISSYMNRYRVPCDVQRRRCHMPATWHPYPSPRATSAGSSVPENESRDVGGIRFALANIRSLSSSKSRIAKILSIFLALYPGATACIESIHAGSKPNPLK